MTDLNYLLQVGQDEANDLGLRDLPDAIDDYAATGAPYIQLGFPTSMAVEMAELIRLAHRVQADPADPGDVRMTPLEKHRQATSAPGADKPTTPAERFPMASLYGAEFGLAIRYAVVMWIVMWATTDIFFY